MIAEKTLHKADKTNTTWLFLIAFAVPTFLSAIAEVFNNTTDLSGIYYTAAGIIFGCAVLGFLFAVGDSGNNKLWRVYTVYAVISAFDVIANALSAAPLGDNFQLNVRIGLFDEHLFSFLADINLILMAIIINGSPLFVPKKNGNGKRLSALYAVIGVFCVICILSQVIETVGKQMTLNDSGKYYKVGEKLCNVYNNIEPVLLIIVMTLLFTPIVLSFNCLRRDRSEYIKLYGRKRATAEVLNNTANGNFFMSEIVQWIVIVIVEAIAIFFPVGVRFIDVLYSILQLFPCLFLLIAFVNDMRRTKIVLKSTIEAEKEARRIAEEKERERQDAERANKEKSSFLANMSHEIRTPINGILGMTQIELDKNPTGELRRSLEMIYSSGKSLLDIINDILDFSKIESGKIDIINAPYDFGSMINDTMVLNVTRIGSKPIEFIPEIDPNIPANLIGDYVHIKQVLNNLLSNAFKYTAEGRVTLNVRMVGENLTVTVTDTGQGMSEESVKKLGEAYTRFNENANVSVEGTGLGMNITRKLIDKMGGTLEIKSELGKGSAFTVSLPQGIEDKNEVIGADAAEKLCSFKYVSARSTADVSAVTPMPYGKVMVVDDNATNLFVAEGLLSVYKLDITTVDSGFAAIDKKNDGNV
jgi:signal transduction histidine kinase